MPITMDHAHVTRALFRAIESGNVDELDRIYHPELVQVEHPNRLLPEGAHRGKAQVLEAARRGRALMASQRFELGHLLESGPSVAVTARWRATLAVDAPPLGLERGATMQADFAQFLVFADGRVVRHETFDCFVPWAASTQDGPSVGRTNRAGGELHFFCGKAGAGKSTRASALAKEMNAVLFSEDVWMARLYSDQLKTLDDYLRLSARLRGTIAPLVQQLLARDQVVVLDFPANTRSLRAWVRGLLNETRASHVLHYIDTPDDTCLSRIAHRNVERPEGSHHLTPEQFRAISAFFEPPSAEEGFDVRRHA
jgi:predicted kinase/ketosteroid isomerase-like protein